MATLNPSKQPSLNPQAVDALKWTPYQEGEASWTFATDREGRLHPKAKPLLDAILASPDKRITIGSYEYSLSSNRKFLQRRPLRNGA